MHRYHKPGYKGYLNQVLDRRGGVWRLESKSTTAFIILATNNDVEYPTKPAIIEGPARVDIHQSIYVES
jgi:hypothetical protein